MATLSLRMRDDLKRKAKNLALREGVSLNNLINATVAACVAQESRIPNLVERQSASCQALVILPKPLHQAGILPGGRQENIALEGLRRILDAAQVEQEESDCHLGGCPVRIGLAGTQLCRHGAAVCRAGRR